MSKLLDNVRNVMRVRHYSYQTEKTYIYWIRQFIFFHKITHPAEMGAAEVEAFLNSGLALVNDEPLTVNWYALKFSDSVFGIFDTFDGDEGRDAHLSGKVAEALMANAAELLAAPPTIEKVDILAAK